MRITSSSSSPKPLLLGGKTPSQTGRLLGMLNDTLLPKSLAGLGNDSKAAVELVPEEAPIGKALEEGATPDELILGRVPVGKGGLVKLEVDMI